MLDSLAKVIQTLGLVKPDCTLPGRTCTIRNPVRSASEVVVHAVDRGRRLGPVVNQSRVVGIRVVVAVVIEFAVDKVSEVGGVVGQVELFEQFDEVIKVEDDRIVLEKNVFAFLKLAAAVIDFNLRLKSFLTYLMNSYLFVLGFAGQIVPN